MELGLPGFLKIIVFLSIQRLSLETSSSSCEVKSLERAFATDLVPNHLRFMIFYRNLSPTSRFLDGNFSCLDGVNPEPSLKPCNPKNESQQWFQIHNSIVNIASGKSLIANASELSFGLWTTGISPWKCEEDSQAPLVSIFLQTSTQKYYLSVNSMTNAVLQNTADKQWGVADNDGERKANFTLLCSARGAFCKPPRPGLHSFLVTTERDLSSYSHLPTTQVEKACETDPKLCYSAGDFVLRACPVGLSDLNNNTKVYSSAVCLGEDLWSDPEPLHCAKRHCGPTPGYKNAVIIPGSATGEDYGDVATYQCVNGYTGPRSRIACGPYGQWTGQGPLCRHLCRSVLTQDSGQILSPNYPQPYPLNISCNWTIEVTQGLRVALYFRDFFIEYGSVLPPSCPFDAVIIMDLALQNPFLIENQELYCGSNFPHRWLSKGNNVTILFISDLQRMAKGFKIDYITWNPDERTEPMEPSFNESSVNPHDDAFVFIGEEHATYYLEGVYAVATTALLIGIAFVLVLHLCTRYGYECSSSASGDGYDPSRRNAIAECGSGAGLSFESSPTLTSPYLRRLHVNSQIEAIALMRERSNDERISKATSASSSFRAGASPNPKILVGLTENKTVEAYRF